MFISNSGTFDKTNVSVEIMGNTKIKHYRQLTLANEIESTPLNYKADFVPSMSCRIIIINDGALEFKMIESNNIERDLTSKTIKINSHLEVIPSGT